MNRRIEPAPNRAETTCMMRFVLDTNTSAKGLTRLSPEPLSPPEVC